MRERERERSSNRHKIMLSSEMQGKDRESGTVESYDEMENVSEERSLLEAGDRAQGMK